MEGAYVQGIGLFMQEEILIDDDGSLISNGTWEVQSNYYKMNNNKKWIKKKNEMKIMKWNEKW